MVLSLLVTMLVIASPARAAGEQVTMGMPFTGRWAYNALTTAACGPLSTQTSHPSCHTISSPGYQWAVDYYGPNGTEVRLYGTSAQGTVTFETGSVETSSCGQLVKVSVKVNGVQVGMISISHLQNIVASTTIAAGDKVGEVYSATCQQGYSHAHFEYKNTAAGNSCHVDHSNTTHTAGMEIAAGSAVGVIGSSNTGAQQACSSMPGSGGSGSAGVALELVHYYQSGSGSTDAIQVTPGGVTGGGVTTIGAVAPGAGQFGLGYFNGDAYPDLYLVVTQGDPSGRSVVFVAAGPSYKSFLLTMGTPMGQFGPAHGDVVIGDFNGDNRSDVGVFFANNGASNAAFGYLNAATNFQSWGYLNSVPIGGHDGTRSDAVAGDFDHNGSLDIGVGFHQGTPSGNVDFFRLSGSSSYQSVAGSTLPLGGWLDGQGQLLSGRFGTANDQLGVVYCNTPSGSPDFFLLNGLSAVANAWTLPVSGAPAGQRVFIGR